jgi:hypothetical protein
MHRWVWLLAAVAGFGACGGQANTVVSATGGDGAGATGNAGASTSSGGATNAGGTGGTGGTGSFLDGGVYDGGGSAYCNPGSWRAVNGVDYSCVNGTWQPSRPCIMAVDATNCCGKLVAARSEDVASDPCLLPYPRIQGDDAIPCPRLPDCTGVSCGEPDWPITRVAAPSDAGKCEPVLECTYAADCVLAQDARDCCSCWDGFPRSLTAGSPCLRLSAAQTSLQCADCSAMDCGPCQPITELSARCAYDGQSRRCLAVSGCEKQDVAWKSPPAGADCTAKVYYWDGKICRRIDLCGCTGTDCAKLPTDGQVCLERYGRCGAWCIPSDHYTCNDDPSMTEYAGLCSEGVCFCSAGYTMNPTTGRCR